MKSFTHKERSEVDIRVAQELKNNRDFIYETGQHIDNLRNSIVSLSIQQEKVRADAVSERTRILIEFENLKESVEKTLCQINQRMGDVETKLLKMLDGFVSLSKEISESYVSQEEFDESIKSFDIQIRSHDDRIEKNFDYLQIAINAAKELLRGEMKILKEELTPHVPEIDPVKVQIEEKFKVWKVDFDGLIKEIALLKRAVSYDQKKFENIYTLINRLKAEECLKKE